MNLILRILLVYLHATYWYRTNMINRSCKLLLTVPTLDHLISNQILSSNTTWSIYYFHRLPRLWNALPSIDLIPLYLKRSLVITSARPPWLWIMDSRRRQTVKFAQALILDALRILLTDLQLVMYCLKLLQCSGTTKLCFWNFIPWICAVKQEIFQ